MINKKVARIILIGLSFGLVVSLLFATTYALFSNDAYGSNPNAFSTGTLSIEVVSKSENISLDNALPMKDEEGVQTTPYIFTVRNSGSVDYLFDIKLLSTDDDNNFSSSYIKLQVNDGEVKTLSQLTNSIIMSQVLLKAGESMDVSLRVWLDWDTPNSELGKSFNSEIVTTGNAVYTEPAVTLVKYITDLYNGYENKVTVSNNSIDYYYADIYDKDTDDNTSGGLMNDRLGGIEELSSGVGNIRYYGANPNNYIYFNCDTYPSTNCELWRIIGVFDGKIKIIRNDSIGNLAWDTDYNNDLSSTTYSNDWYNSSLQIFLNGLYYNRGTKTSHIYYSVAGSTQTTLQLQNIGIKESTRSMIDDSTWFLGGTGDWYTFANEIYEIERNGNKCDECTYDSNWPGKIALMYVSDYGYATDFTKCIEQNLANYSNSGCYGNDWLYKKDNTISQWCLTPDGSSNSASWYIVPDGAGYVYWDDPVYYELNVYPTLYLSPNKTIESGHTGTESDPHRISAS